MIFIYILLSLKVYGQNAEIIGYLQTKETQQFVAQIYEASKNSNDASSLITFKKLHEENKLKINSCKMELVSHYIPLNCYQVIHLLSNLSDEQYKIFLEKSCLKSVESDSRPLDSKTLEVLPIECQKRILQKEELKKYKLQSIY